MSHREVGEFEEGRRLTDGTGGTEGTAVKESNTSPPPSGVSHEARQGFLILGIVTLLASGVFFMEEIRGWTDESVALVVEAPDASGLEKGSTVWIAGIPSGRVTRVELRPPASATDRRVIVHTRVLERKAHHLRAGTTARVRAPLPLVPPVLALDPGPRDAPPLDFADTLTADPQISAEDLMALADTVRRPLDSLASASRELTAALERSNGLLPALGRDPALRARFAAGVSGLREFLDRVRGNRALDSVLTVGSAPLLDTILGRLAVASDSLASRGPALDTLGRDLSALAARLEKMSGEVESGEGTAGRFLYDGELGRQLELLRRRMRDTPAFLMDDPLAWLRVRLF